MTTVAVATRRSVAVRPDGAPVPVVLTAEGDEVGTGWVRLDPGGAGGRPTATMWAPRLRPGLDGPTRAAAFDAFAGWVVSTVAAASAATVETKPADDVAHLSEWLAALRRRGFAEVAVAHLLTRSLPVAAAPGPPYPGLAVAPLDGLRGADRLAVEALVATVHRASADRVDALDRLAGADVLARLAGDRVATPAPRLWLVATAGARPVGYVLGSVDGDDVWVMDVGVDPAERGRGIGHWLLTTMLAGAGPARRACALVDDENLPSRRLHAAAGFAEERGAYRTWRLGPAGAG